MRSFLSLLVSFILCSGFASAAENKTTARALALEAQEAFQAGKFERAADLLSRAEKYYHAPPHLVLEARARTELGQLVQARELLLAVVNEPEGQRNAVFDQARAEARDLLDALEPRVPRLTVEVLPSAVDGLELTLDGAPWAADLVGVASPVNPGKHLLVARAPGFEQSSAEIQLAEGQKEELSLKLVPGGSAGAEPASSEPYAAPATAEDHGTTGKGPTVLSYALWGTGLVGVGVGTAFVVMGADKSSQAAQILDDSCTPLANGGYGCSQDTHDEVSALDQDAATQQTVGGILIGVGAAALVAGTVFALLPKKSKEVAVTRRQPRFSAFPLVGGGYLSLQGEFE